MPFPLPHIALAQPPVIDDRRLHQLTLIARNADNGMASPAECEWLLATCAPLFDELARRRAWMDGHAKGVDLSNVITLSAAR